MTTATDNSVANEFVIKLWEGRDPDQDLSGPHNDRSQAVLAAIRFVAKGWVQTLYLKPKVSLPFWDQQWIHLSSLGQVRVRVELRDLAPLLLCIF